MIGFDPITIGEKVIKTIKKVMKIRSLKKLEGKYVSFISLDGSINCGLLINSDTFGDGKAFTIKNIENGEESVYFWDKCNNFKYNENIDYIIKVNNELKQRIEREVIRTLTSSKAFYEACKKIHLEYSSVSILSKSPILLLPTERNLTEFRKNYFKTILNRLKEGVGNYHLRYLFDRVRFKNIIMNYYYNGNKKLIDEVSETLNRLLSFDNIDLRIGYTEPLTGCVIGGNNVACIGFKNKEIRAITEGVLVKAPELVKIFVYQYNELYNKAIKVEEGLINEILREVVSIKKE